MEPGLYFTIPVIRHGTIRVDQRTIATPFYAEKTLTADLVTPSRWAPCCSGWCGAPRRRAPVWRDYYAAVSFLA